MPETKERKPVLETRKLGISFGGLKAVQDFNIQIYPGELIGLIGPNGAGKTTVFNMLTGVYVPTEGTVMLNGVPLNGKKAHQFVAAGVARTCQIHTTGRALQKVDTPYQGGFASTAKTDDTINFSLINMEAEILNSLYRARGTVIDFLNMG